MVAHTVPHAHHTIKVHLASLRCQSPTEVQVSAMDQSQTGSGDGDGATELVDQAGNQQHVAETAPDTMAIERAQYPPGFDPAAVVVQASWRGFAARKKYEEIQTTRQWAAVKLQSYFRGRQARRVYSRRIRYIESENQTTPVRQ